MIASEYCIVQTTVGDEQEARSMAEMLVTKKLAACVQILPIASVYRWKGQIRNSEEYLLLIKTRADRFLAIEALIRQHHPYELPEIVQIAITDGSSEYLKWIDSIVSDER